jgi:uncharacterized membrane protein
MKATYELFGRLLTAGVTLSAACLAVGLAVAFAGRTRDVTPPAARLLLDAGLIVLMATPLLRVLVSLSEEVRNRNWFFAGITFIVVVVLAATLWTAL